MAEKAAAASKEEQPSINSFADISSTALKSARNRAPLNNEHPQEKEGQSPFSDQKKRDSHLFSDQTASIGKEGQSPFFRSNGING